MTKQQTKFASLRALKIGTALMFGAVLSAGVSAHASEQQVKAVPSFKHAEAAQAEGDYYASQAIAAKDWAAAIEKLEARSDKDPFRMLNLATAYQNVGRQAEAIALYQQVMKQRVNPYADLGAKETPRRVKAIARDKVLAMSDSDIQP